MKERFVNKKIDIIVKINIDNNIAKYNWSSVFEIYNKNFLQSIF